MTTIEFNDYDIEYQTHYGEIWIHANDLARAFGHGRLQRLDKRPELQPVLMIPTARGSAWFLSRPGAMIFLDTHPWFQGTRSAGVKKLRKKIGEMAELYDLL